MKTKMHTLFLALFLSSSFAAFGSGAVAWTGDGDGWRWEDPNNWENDEVPGEQDDVRISGNAYVQVTAAGAACRSAWLEDNVTLLIRNEANLTVAYAYQEGIDMDDNSTLVIWGELEIHHTGEDDYAGNGIEIDGDARVFNYGSLSIHDTDMDGDGIDMEDDALFENYGSLYISEIDNEGIEMDNDAIFRNRGLLEIQYVSSDAIDQDDEDTEFINDGVINIAFISSEGIEVDDGTFTNSENGEINIGFVSADMVYVQTGGFFENYGEVYVLTPFIGRPPIRTFPEVEEGQTPGEAFDPEVAQDVQIESDGAIYVEGFGRFENHNLVDIGTSFGIINIATEGPEVSGMGVIPISAYGALVTSADGVIENMECAVINIEGPFPIVNEGYLYNEGTIDLSLEDIPFAPAQVPPGPVLVGNVNTGYFYNDGDILSDFPFSIGPNAIDEEWARYFIGGQGENDSFSLGCGITVATSSLHQYGTTADNMAFLGQSLCGNGMITARVEEVSNGWAGIVIRESSDAGARSLSLLSNGVTLYRRGLRQQPNGPTQNSLVWGAPAGWMRLERQGSILRGYRSFNGVNWQLVTQVFINFPSCVEIGLAAYGDRAGLQAQGVFEDVEVNGGGYGLSADESAPQALGLRGGHDEAGSVPDLQAPAAQAAVSEAVVYPNPSTGQIYLQLPSPLLADEPLQVYDVLGQEVYQAVCPAGQAEIGLDLSGLPAGRYLLRVHGQALPLLLTR